jgi:hypothetical protein
LKRILNEESGAALVMTLIVMLVLTILGTALLNISLAENKFAKRNEDKLQAYYIARSGAHAVAEYIAKDNSGDAENMFGFTSVKNITHFINGEVQVTVLEDAINDDILHISSQGIFNGISQTAKIRFHKTGGLFDFAVIAQDDVVTGNNTTINGDLLSIDGTIKRGNGTPYTTETDLILPGIEEPDEYSRTLALHNLFKTDVTIPLVHPNDTYIENKPGIYDYYFKTGSIDLKQSKLVVKDITGLTPNGTKPNLVVHLYVEGDITVDTQSYFDVDPNALLFIYVIGERTIEFSGAGIPSRVYLYAPESDIVWQNAQPSTIVNGGMVGKNVNVSENVTITHNKGLGDYANLTTAFYRWVD